MSTDHEPWERESWDRNCAAVPHYLLNITIVWCPHELRYVVHASHTDDAGAALAAYRHPLGPFDGAEEVVASAAHEVLRWLGVDHERRAQERE